MNLIKEFKQIYRKHRFFTFLKESKGDYFLFRSLCLSNGYTEQDMEDFYNAL